MSGLFHQQAPISSGSSFKEATTVMSCPHPMLSHGRIVVLLNYPSPHPLASIYSADGKELQKLNASVAIKQSSLGLMELTTGWDFVEKDGCRIPHCHCFEILTAISESPRSCSNPTHSVSSCHMEI